MKRLQKHFSIREDYISRPQAFTFVENSQDYWNADRIRNSLNYQYYVYKRTSELISKMKNCSFLDVGCGYPKKVAHFIQPHTRRITLIDQPSMTDIIRRDYPWYRFIPMNLEQPSVNFHEKFDCVCAADVMEHLLDPDPLMNFLRQVCNYDGLVLISTPERDMQRGYGCIYSPQAEHVREWTAAELSDYVQQSGFDILEHHLLPREKLFTCEERLPQSIRQLYKKRYLSCQLVVCAISGQHVKSCTP